MEGDDGFREFWINLWDISIHSLRMEGDPVSIYVCSIGKLISIHSLRMEGDDSGK